jgi:hypothetical protein
VYYEPFFLNKTWNQFNTIMVSAKYNEERERLRYEWATKKDTNYGLARVTGISDQDAVRYKQKIDQRYSALAFAQHTNVSPDSHSSHLPTFGSAEWIARDAYIDTLINNLNNVGANNVDRFD